MGERYKLFTQDGNKVTQANKYCPKCGEGVFLAEHENRRSCGKCGYTEFMKK
jgi:small subunit ribosomal protein S27Ae